MIEPRPIQRPRESMLAYYNRVNEWEARMKPLIAKAARDIDSACSKSPISNQRATTRETERSRLSIHDYAQTNPILLKILRAKPHLA
jgi:hypothetical protein